MLIFNTKEEALNYLREQSNLNEFSKELFEYKGEYHLSNNEYSSPTIMVRKYSDGWKIYKKTFYYNHNSYSGIIDEF